MTKGDLMKILMTGATGLIGKKLGLALVKQGHELTIISRDKVRAKHELPFPCEVLAADLNQAPVEIKNPFDIVINLLGESVADGRWTKSRKDSILNSRVIGTRNLISMLKYPPKMIISANAIGYYGDRGDELLNETSTPGADFLSEVCINWQKEHERAQEKFGNKTKLASLRVGLVLSRNGGALTKMLFPFRVGLGGPLASGRQYMSWIHLDDLVQMFCFIIEKQLSGIFNAVAPNPVTNLEFSKTLARTLSRPLGFAVPRFVLKLGLGEVANAILESQKVSSEKIRKLGFEFRFDHIEAAFIDLLTSLRSSSEIYEFEQFVPQRKDKIFEFFSQAKNLECLTPKNLKFHIKNMSTPAICLGTLIDYRLKIRGIPVGWQTLIDEWNPDSHFVDIQLKGPYKIWHHRHEFIDLPGGTLVCDRVQFKLPAGFLGWLLAGFFVRADVQKIFAFRRKAIFEMFCEG